MTNGRGARARRPRTQRGPAADAAAPAAVSAGTRSLTEDLLDPAVDQALAVGGAQAAS
jgi:hypothetical protein